MSELEPRKRRRKAVTPRRIPSEVVPIPPGEAPDFVRDALKGTSLRDPFATVLGGYVAFAPRFVAVDETHTRIEFDAEERVPGADMFLYTRRLGEIDRFFVALHDELDRREERARRSAGRRAIEPPPSSAIEPPAPSAIEPDE